MRRILIFGSLLILLGSAVASVSARTGPHTPAVGSAERKAILDGVRRHRNAPNELYTPREFNVLNGWAYVSADDPNEPGVDTAAFDYVLRKSGGKWNVVDEVSHVEGTNYASEIKRIRKRFHSVPAAIFPNP